MNPTLRRANRVSPLAWLALLSLLVNAVAQPSAELDIQTYAGLTITGEVGKIYSVEFTEPAESDWRCLEYLQLPASPYLWADTSAPVTGKRFYRAVAMEVPTNMVFSPPGRFRMGSPTNEFPRLDWEGPQTDVIISRGFFIGKYEVTQADYQGVMGTNPSYFIGIGDIPEPGTDYGTNLNRPVEQVEWTEAVDYCNKLTQRHLLEGHIPLGCEYRLPTEAEWEYSARGGTSTRFSYGEAPGFTNITDYAWTYESSNLTTHSVGGKLPNPWGLYDVHGNVWEWCSDWMGDYPGNILVDPSGPSTGLKRVIRGGDWLGNARSSRSPSRAAITGYSSSVGFRVVLAPTKP